MDHRWTIYGGKAEKQRSFLYGKPYLPGEKNKEREKRKIPHRQKNHEKLMEVWEMRELLNRKQVNILPIKLFKKNYN